MHTAMNDAMQNTLKIHVERAVRPLRASFSCKRRMRETLLARAVKTFTDLRGTSECPLVALDQTIQTLGHPAKLTSQLQATVSPIDRLEQILEGHPNEPAWRSALGFVVVVALFSVAALVVTLFFVGFDRPWALQELWAISTGPEHLPLCMFHAALVLSGFVLAVHYLEKQLDGALPENASSFWSALLKQNSRRSLIKAWFILNTTLLFILFTANRNALSSAKIYWTILLLAPLMTLFATWGAWHMVRLAQEKRQHHAEWSHLPLEEKSF